MNGQSSKLDVTLLCRGRVLLTLEEVSCLIGNQITSEVLGRVHQAGDDCSPPISALEKVTQGRRATQMCLNLNGSFNHGKLLLRIILVFISKALDGPECLFLASAAHEPPRGFGREKDEDQEWSLREVMISCCILTYIS